ncbi:collagen alpha-1(I) chain-like isoform X2 [Xenopus tropicalis]|uniref:Collagen alpha-1(I) chain-like isoform X2 n=1 Tax=Xenopus tropicalis TaxID=8364 RepID=A0A8J1JN94_XENTR|nr:collagen alpha-1(I) chain-like isoform X2 [Xenopus tropicalis]
MATNLDVMLAQIRAEAERRGDDWLRQFLPSQDEQQPTTPTRRPRRSRPPTRLSPSPPVRRRRPTTPSPQPSTSMGTGRSRAPRSKGPAPSTPPTRQRDPDTPTGRPRGGRMATRRRDGGPEASGDDVTDTTGGTSGSTMRLRRQASTGSREGSSAIRAGQAEAPGPRGGRGAAARGRLRAGGPEGGDAGALRAAPSGGGEAAPTQATCGTAWPRAAMSGAGGGPAGQQSWAQGTAPDRGGGAEAAQAAWHTAHTGECGPTTSVAGAQGPPTAAQAAWITTRPGAGLMGSPTGQGGLPTTTQEGGALAGSPGYRPPQPPRQLAGPAGSGQESQGWPPAPTGEANRAVPTGAAAGREGTTAAHSVAAQGMPPPLGFQQVPGPGNGDNGIPQQQQGITPGASGQDSATTNYNSSAVEQVPGASAGSGAGGRAVPRPCMESGASDALQCKVWLMGHSFIHWAERRASVRHANRQLGFPVSQVKLHWVSRRGLRWDEIVPRAVQKAKESGPPSVILIHAGGNDLGLCPMKALISTIRTDCFRLRSLFEGLIIIWSDIIPRTHWRGARSHRAINRVRIKVNKAVASNVQKNGGLVVRHRELENNMAFFRTDGIHLNEVGLDLFNFNLQEAITLAWKSWRRMQS